MIDECVVAVFLTLDKARDAVHRLIETGFPAAQVSFVTLGLKDDPAVIEELDLSDDSKYAAAVIAGLGSLVGLLGGLNVMILSGLGAVFLIGPLSGAILGGISGAYFGALSGWGVHKHQIKHFQRLVEEGNVVIIANGEPVQLLQAYRLLEQMDPMEVHTYARMGDEAPERE